jgi:hypothetical protein
MVAMQHHDNEKWARGSPGRRLREQAHPQNEYAPKIVQLVEMSFDSIFSSVHIAAMDFGIRKRVSGRMSTPDFEVNI